MILGSKVQSVRRADNRAAICEPIVYIMWDPRHLTTLYASMASYGDSFTFTFIQITLKRNFLAVCKDLRFLQ
jgi:hypothetical protein